MSDPLKFSKSGIPSRTSRDRGRAHGAKVPPKPAVGDYCPAHGVTHALGGACSFAAADKEAETISQSGGGAKLPATIKPFKLGV